MTTTSLPANLLGDTAARLKKANAPIMQRFIGESAARQPVHTVYGGAQLFKKDAAEKLGQSALRVMGEYAPDATTFARAVGIPPSTWYMPACARSSSASRWKIFASTSKMATAIDLTTKKIAMP